MTKPGMTSPVSESKIRARIVEQIELRRLRGRDPERHADPGADQQRPEHDERGERRDLQYKLGHWLPEDERQPEVPARPRP